MGLYYDKQGKVISLGMMAVLLEKPNYSRIREDTLPNKKWVSTVWLGLNYQWTEGDPPLIFETMVFSKHGDWDELDCERYATLEEALRGHKRMVKKWKEE
jgi:hypothetical protein